MKGTEVFCRKRRLVRNLLTNLKCPSSSINVLKNAAIDLWRSPPASCHTLFLHRQEAELMDILGRLAAVLNRRWRTILTQFVKTAAAVSLLTFSWINKVGNLYKLRAIHSIHPVAFKMPKSLQFTHCTGKKKYWSFAPWYEVFKVKFYRNVMWCTYVVFFYTN